MAVSTKVRTWQRKLETYVDEDLHQTVREQAWGARLPVSQWLKQAALEKIQRDGGGGASGA